MNKKRKLNKNDVRGVGAVLWYILKVLTFGGAPGAVLATLLYLVLTEGYQEVAWAVIKLLSN